MLWPVLVYGAIVLSLVMVMLGLSYVLGERHRERATGEPYEGGIVSTGSARLRFSSQFYLIAMLFVIFDVETMFIVSWAIAFPELGWYGYLGVLVFVVLLFVVLIYEWRNGALDFGPDGKKILQAYKKRKGGIDASLLSDLSTPSPANTLRQKKEESIIQ